jgi:hypothetical protein
MSVTFKCKTSGVTVTFVDQVDIDSMKGHPEYDVVEAEVFSDKVEPATSAASEDFASVSELCSSKEQSFPIEEQPKKLGRPKKADTE